MAKIGREVMRIVHRLGDRLRDLPEGRAQRRHDAAFPAMLRQTPGARPRSGHVAVLVLYQPGGVAGSALLTLDHLAAAGYAALAVSNAPLAPADRAALAARAWRVVERPNLGYDFGAYRDAIRLIAAEGMARRLILLNDSIWFPLAPGDDLIARIEGLGAPFAGASHEEKPGRAHRAHLQSFFYLLDAPLLGHPAFAAFWRGYPLSSVRRKVLARGEKGFSAAMAAAGFAAAAPASRRALLAALERFSPADLRLALEYAADPDPARAAERAGLLRLPDAALAGPARAHIAAATAGSGYAERFPLASARAFGLHYLKKRMEPLSLAARRAVLAAIDAGHLAAPAGVVHDEMRAATPPGPDPA